jgi:Sec7-like guanine-nucleotide exchange factor
MRKKLTSKLDELDKHLAQLKKNLNYLEVFYTFPLKEKYIKIILESSDIDKLDSIAYRIIKFQDSLGRVIKLFFSIAEENTDMLTMIDLINLAEKVGFDIDVRLWRELRELRNNLTHEYTESFEKIAYALNRLKELLPRFEKILDEVKVRSSGL